MGGGGSGCLKFPNYWNRKKGKYSNRNLAPNSLTLRRTHWQLLWLLCYLGIISQLHKSQNHCAQAVTGTSLNLNENLTRPIKKIRSGQVARWASSVSRLVDTQVHWWRNMRLPTFLWPFTQDLETQLIFHFRRKGQKAFKLKVSTICNFICKLRTEMIYWFIIFNRMFPSLRIISKPRLWYERRCFN